MQAQTFINRISHGNTVDIPGSPLKLTQLVFRYRGPMDFVRFFKESKAFFGERKMDFAEKVYKNKGDEIEGAWEIYWRTDEYTKITYEIEFKLTDSKNVTVERDGKKIEMIDGRMRIIITAKADVNYGEKSIAGPQEIFPKKNGKESWLHKVYYKVTFRDRDEGTYGEAVIIAQQYIETIKGIFGVEARY